MDAAGNATLLSPHNFELYTPDASQSLPFAYYSENAFVGKRINVDMYGAIAELERLSGKQFIYETDIPALDWDADQDLQAIQHAERKERHAQRKADTATRLNEWKDAEKEYKKALKAWSKLDAAERGEEPQFNLTKPEFNEPDPGDFQRKEMPAWIAARVPQRGRGRNA